MSAQQDIMKPDDVGISIVPVLACVLNQLCTRNDRLSQKGVSKFHALRPPAIGIKDYLNRVLRYATCSGECFILALVYIDRIIQSNPTFVVNSLNIHRLLITSVMLAAKYFDDQYFNNAYYAKVGGIPGHEMNNLEVEFLFMTNFTLFVNTDTYTQYYTELCNHASNPNNTCHCSIQRVPPLNIPCLDSNDNVHQHTVNADMYAVQQPVPQQPHGKSQSQLHHISDTSSEVDSNTSSQHSELQQKLQKTDISQDVTDGQHTPRNQTSSSLSKQLQQQQSYVPQHPITHSTSNNMMTESPAIHTNTNQHNPYVPVESLQQSQHYAPIQQQLPDPQSQQYYPPQQQVQPQYNNQYVQQQQQSVAPSYYQPPQQQQLQSQQLPFKQPSHRPHSSYSSVVQQQSYQSQQYPAYSTNDPYTQQYNDQSHHTSTAQSQSSVPTPRSSYRAPQYYQPAHGMNIPNRHNDIIRQNEDNMKNSSPPVTSF